jgi:quercetin dioxygenase-like cupin family protein
MKSAIVALGLISLVSVMPLGSVLGAELNPDAITILTPDDFEWRSEEPVPANSVDLYGDRNGDGYYVYLNKFAPGSFSRPHYHQNDRYITVVKGTWWVGTGSDFDPDNNTVPLPVGSFVVHTGGEVHYDGAKDEEVWVLISGIGPSAGTDVEITNQD